MDEATPTIATSIREAKEYLDGIEGNVALISHRDPDGLSSMRIADSMLSHRNNRPKICKAVDYGELDDVYRELLGVAEKEKIDYFVFLDLNIYDQFFMGPDYPLLRLQETSDIVIIDHHTRPAIVSPEDLGAFIINPFFFKDNAIVAGKYPASMTTYNIALECDGKFKDELDWIAAVGLAGDVGLTKASESGWESFVKGLRYPLSEIELIAQTIKLTRNYPLAQESIMTARKPHDILKNDVLRKAKEEAEDKIMKVVSEFEKAEKVEPGLRIYHSGDIDSMAVADALWSAHPEKTLLVYSNEGQRHRWSVRSGEIDAGQWITNSFGKLAFSAGGHGPAGGASTKKENEKPCIESATNLYRIMIEQSKK